MTTWITICDTCKREGWEAGGVGKTDGEKLADLIEGIDRDAEQVKIRLHSCLMGCSNSCNVAIQADGKLAYTLGDFTPDAESAEAILGYANLHAQSDTGQVPYKQWPQGVKGHFVTRHPPIPTDED